MNLVKLKAGEDSRKNWRTINEVMAAAAAAHSLGVNHSLALSALNKLPRDTVTWHWATPKEYDSAKEDYLPNEIVLVSPSNAAVVAGDAIAGLFVCLRLGTWAAGPVIKYPIWPLPNATIAHTSNYWMLIALYPTLMTYCLNGVETDYYVNAQPVPTVPE